MIFIIIILTQITFNFQLPGEVESVTEDNMRMYLYIMIGMLIVVCSICACVCFVGCLLMYMARMEDTRREGSGDNPVTSSPLTTAINPTVGAAIQPLHHFNLIAGSGPLFGLSGIPLTSVRIGQPPAYTPVPKATPTKSTRVITRPFGGAWHQIQDDSSDYFDLSHQVINLHS